MYVLKVNLGYMRTKPLSAKHICSRQYSKIDFAIIQSKIRLDISRESSAYQTIHIKCQALIFSENKIENFQSVICCSYHQSCYSLLNRICVYFCFLLYMYLILVLNMRAYVLCVCVWGGGDKILFNHNISYYLVYLQLLLVSSAQRHLPRHDAASIV